MSHEYENSILNIREKRKSYQELEKAEQSVIKAARKYRQEDKKKYPEFSNRKLLIYLGYLTNAIDRLEKLSGRVKK